MAHFYLSTKFPDVPEAAAGLGLKPEIRGSELADTIKQLMKPEIVSEEPPPPSFSQGIPNIKLGYIMVKDSAGKYWQLPADRAEEAVLEGGQICLEKLQQKNTQ